MNIVKAAILCKLTIELAGLECLQGLFAEFAHHAERIEGQIDTLAKVQYYSAHEEEMIFLMSVSSDYHRREAARWN